MIILLLPVFLFAAEVVTRTREVDLDKVLDSINSITPKTNLISLPKKGLKVVSAQSLYLLAKHRNRPQLAPFNYKEVSQTWVTFLSAEILKMNGMAFVKLGGRSPKDYLEKRPDRVLGKYQEMLGERSCTSTASVRAKTLLEAATFIMKATNGEEALDLLINSQRVEEDLETFLESGETEIFLAIREYLDIPIENEFRGFVYNNSLNAISQAFHTLKFTELTDISVLTQEMKSFWEKEMKAKPQLNSLSNYVIDFAKTRDGRWIVIELNPFNEVRGQGTDGMLFDWERDQHILRTSTMSGPVLRTRQSDPSSTELEQHFRNWPLDLKELLGGQCKAIKK